jgi:hypothetical protein
VDDVTAERDERADVRNFWIERRVSGCMFWQMALIEFSKAKECAKRRATVKEVRMDKSAMPAELQKRRKGKRGGGDAR